MTTDMLRKKFPEGRFLLYPKSYDKAMIGYTFNDQSAVIAVYSLKKLLRESKQDSLFEIEKIHPLNGPYAPLVVIDT